LSKRKIKLAICQLKSGIEKEKNLKKAENMVKEAGRDSADIIVLPEMFNTSLDMSVIKSGAESFGGPTTDLLSGLARKTESILVGGSIPEKEAEKIYNTSFIFAKDGSLAAKHRKIHLFDVDIEGGISYKESSVITPGNKVTVLKTDICKIGVMICYDMRFPELSRAMVDMGAEILITPAAFNMTTGPSHWHITSRVRALDNQVFFIAASPARDENLKYVAYGHSLCVDPWGRIISEATEKEEIIYCTIDLDYLDKIRKSLPLLKHLKKDLY